MPSSPSFRPAVLQVREQLAAERLKLRQQHDSGSPGIQVCARLAAMLDETLLTLMLDAAERAGVDDWQAGLALVAHGGYGRRDVAPFSDVDLMILHSGTETERIAPLARYFSQHIYDVGLSLGFSVRTIGEACSGALRDATIFTSLAESRLLGGDQELFNRFLFRFRRAARRRWRRLMDTIDSARRGERQQYGETVYLLEPNVKRSRGGLRDIQLVRWIGFARYGQTDLNALVRSDWMDVGDYRLLRAARDFLLRLRNELHFRAGKSQDVLNREEQVRIAELYGYRGSPGVLPVEEFMRTYFEHTGNVRYASAHFVASARPRSTTLRYVEPLVSHHVGSDYLVGPVHIRTTRRSRQRVTQDLAEVLRLMDLANLYGKRIEHQTWQAIRSSMLRGRVGPLSAEAAERFLSLMSQPGRLADLLRRLHEMRVLEQIIPAMSHARCRVQFNEYHKYTVDEHSLQAIQAATEFLTADSPLGDAYRGLAQKRLLHLALLLHDLGKGFEEDHSEVGRRIAEQTAERLNLSTRESEMLKTLVHKHLRMAHLAFRHDLNDDSTAIQLAVEMGSPYMLQMLYVLTCADLAGVGPGVLNDWKLTLLTQLYFRARDFLTQDPGNSSTSQALHWKRESLRKLVGQRADHDWWDRLIQELPNGCLLAESAEDLVRQLDLLKQLPRNQATAWGRYLPERKAVAYTVGTHEEITPGIFHKLTGALSSQRMQILSAEIFTLSDELVLDRFYVEDLDFTGPPPAARIEEVCDKLAKALSEPQPGRPVFRRVWNPKAEQPRMSELPTRVQFDNSTSDRFTIITVFAYDRLGLLYDISRTLFENGLSVHVAKIATHLDQVVDVFYVHDAQGRKITLESVLESIRRKVLTAIEAGDVSKTKSQE